MTILLQSYQTLHSHSLILDFHESKSIHAVKLVCKAVQHQQSTRSPSISSLDCRTPKKEMRKGKLDGVPLFLSLHQILRDMQLTSAQTGSDLLAILCTGHHPQQAAPSPSENVDSISQSNMEHCSVGIADLQAQ